MGLPHFNARIALLHQSQLWFSVGIMFSHKSTWSDSSCVFVALSNLVCKLEAVEDVIKLALSCKSSWDISVSDSLPSASDCHLATSVLRAI